MVGTYSHPYPMALWYTHEKHGKSTICPQRHAWQVHTHGKKTYLDQGRKPWSANLRETLPKKWCSLYHHSVDILLGSKNPRTVNFWWNCCPDSIDVFINGDTLRQSNTRSKSVDGLDTVQLITVWKLFRGWCIKNHPETVLVYPFMIRPGIVDVFGYSRNDIYGYIHITNQSGDPKLPKWAIHGYPIYIHV